MRTVSGMARRVQRLVGRWRPAATPVAQVRPLAAGRRPLIVDKLGEQRRGGVKLDQMDGTTCGSAVLLAVAAWADPAETKRLDGGGDGRGRAAVGGGAAPGVRAAFGVRYDARQKQVHRESARFWPKALGTPPWGMVSWLRHNVPAAGPYRVRLVDDMDRRDVADVVRAVEVALRARRPVPLLVGPVLPRHYVMAVGLHDQVWRVYEPTSGHVRALDPALIGRRALGAVLGFDRLHAAFLPA